MIVVDASALVTLLIDPRSVPQLLSLFRLEEDQVLAPHLIDPEILHVLRRLARLKEITGDRAEAAITRLALLPIERVPHLSLLGRVWELRFNLSAYDAIYVALAEQYGAELLTRDARISRSAGHTAKITLLV